MSEAEWERRVADAWTSIDQYGLPRYQRSMANYPRLLLEPEQPET
jgi:hypothetical protein